MRKTLIAFALLAAAQTASAQTFPIGEPVFNWMNQTFEVQVPMEICMGGSKPSSSDCRHNQSFRSGLVSTTGVSYRVDFPSPVVIKSIRFQARDNFGSAHRAAINVRLDGEVIHGQGNPANGGSLDQAREIENMVFDARATSRDQFQISVQSGHYSNDMVRTSGRGVRSFAIENVYKPGKNNGPDDMAVSNLVIEFLPEQLACY